MRSKYLFAAAALIGIAVGLYALGFVPHALATGGLGLALTVPPSFPARNTGEQQLHYFRCRFTVAQVAAFSAGQKIGRLPARSFIHSIKWHKSVAFNSATTDTLQLGTTAAGVDILAATTITGAGYVDHTAAAGLGIVVGTAGEVDLFAKYVQSGAAASTGDVTLVVAYIPDGDL